jgi:hypothetical protein
MVNWFSFLQYLPTVISLIPQVQSVFNTTPVGTESKVSAVVQAAAPALVPLLEQAGAQMFPKLAPSLHVAAAAIISFHPDAVSWLQASLNTIDNAGLTVDGQYGPLTRAALEAFQTKNGLAVTGWASDAENSLITLALSKL